MALRSPSGKLTLSLTLVGAIAFACTGPEDVVATRPEATNGTGGLWTGLPDGGAGGAAAPELLSLSGDLEAHDPTLVRSGNTFFLFHTGPLLPLKVSSNLLDWEAMGAAFERVPTWIPETLPDVTDLWAPDLAEFGGLFHLYYAASTFGTGVSCIGHATTIDLRIDSTWEDQGPIICSDVEEIVDWDAIDPSTFVGEDGDRYMVFGSYSSGVKLIRLAADGSRADDSLVALAARPIEVALQAPAAVYRDPYYYLFVTFGRCCAGVDSTSSIRVGRSSAVTGPYQDKDGLPMLEGGGSILIDGNVRFPGAGASSVFEIDERMFMAYHAYDANAAGRAVLRISELTWDTDEWPLAAGP